MLREMEIAMRKAGWRLVEVKTGREVEFGEVLTDLRGKREDVLTGGEPPRHSGSTGRVHIEGGNSFYPSVYGLQWLPEPEAV